MKKILYVAVLLVLISGCGQKKPVSQVHHFKNSTWERFKHLNFELPVENTRHTYDLSLVVRYNENFPENTLPINVVMTTPEGEERIKEYTFFIKDKDGNFAGNPTGGIYQMVIPLRNDVRFVKTGLCKFEIENLTPKYLTTGMIEFGVVMERAKEKKKE